MKEDKRIKRVTFIEESARNAFEKLKEGRFEDKTLYEFIDRAIDDLEGNPFVGVRIAKRLWPKEYIQKYQANNLWKYDLPNGWRMIYTITTPNKIEIISIILEWFNHPEYERRFHY